MGGARCLRIWRGHASGTTRTSRRSPYVPDPHTTDGNHVTSDLDLSNVSGTNRTRSGPFGLPVWSGTCPTPRRVRGHPVRGVRDIHTMRRVSHCPSSRCSLPAMFPEATGTPPEGLFPLWLTHLQWTHGQVQVLRSDQPSPMCHFSLLGWELLPHHRVSAPRAPPRSDSHGSRRGSVSMHAMPRSHCNDHRGPSMHGVRPLALRLHHVPVPV